MPDQTAPPADDVPFCEDWVAEQLLAAPDGVLTRQQLRDAAPVRHAVLRYSDDAYARRRTTRPTSGRNRGTRHGEYVRRGVKTLAREGLVDRDGEYVRVIDRAALLDWLYEDADAADAAVDELDARRA